MCENQEIYNNWIRVTAPAIQDIMCGVGHVSANETYFINQYARSMVLDVGCGTGNRTFPFWINRNIDFIGVEKYQNLINASHSPEKVIMADFSDSSFQDHLKPILDSLEIKPDIVFLFGGVVNGILCKDQQHLAWSNFAFLLQYCSCILIDTLTHFPWFEDSDNGRVEQVYPSAPPQYFYSTREIERLNQLNNIQIVDERTEQLPYGISRTHYLLKRN